jgi:hypothetical protein
MPLLPTRTYGGLYLTKEGRTVLAELLGQDHQ